MRATQALIHLDNLKSNIEQIKSRLAHDVKMCIAVKADAYGHGAIECAKIAAACGADFLAVATVDEACELRNANIKTPILMLSLCSPEEAEDAVKYDVTPLVFDEDYAALFNSACIKQKKTGFKVHLAVDTGMGRIGCLYDQAADIAKKINSFSNITLGGMCTHFAVSDSLKPRDIEYTKKQFELFKSAIQSVKDAGIEPGICHCANSAATLNNPEMHLNMVRPGIIVYGYYADEISKEFLEQKNIKIDLKPVMTLQTKICSIRNFNKGQSIGYGCTWTCTKPAKIAVLPIGYADGLFRRFSTEGVKIAVNKKACPIRGRICMDQCMIELQDKTERWDTAVVFGDSDFGALQTADDVACITNTISYEITCGISKRVPRIFLKSR